MPNIIKAVFDDETELTLTVEPKQEVLETDTDREKYAKHYDFYKQFDNFTRQVLDKLPEITVSSYAQSNYDLIEESDAESHCDSDHLYDCTNDELHYEAQRRGLMPRVPENIVAVNFYDRFCQIVTTESPLAVDAWLSEMEQKLRIVS